MTATKAPETTNPAPAEPGDRAPISGRLFGIDLARGLALLGMFTVHVSISDGNSGEPTGVWYWLLHAPSGRASVLFFTLSGLSLALINRRGSASAKPAILRRRGFILLLGGLLLTNTIWSGSILEHYGVMFLFAPWLMRRSNRTIAGMALAGIILGPVARMLMVPTYGRVSSLSDGAVGWVLETIFQLAFGQYPLVVWFGFFALGIALGRLDLSNRRTAIDLATAGVVGVMLVWGSTAGLEAIDVKPPTPAYESSSEDPFGSSGPLEDFDKEKLMSMSDAELKQKFPELFASKEKFGSDPMSSYAEVATRDPLQLLDTKSHSNNIAWALQSAAIALSVLGLSLLITPSLQRFFVPLATLGSMSLSAYLIHIVLVTDGWDLLVDPSKGNVSFTRQVITLIGLQALLVALSNLYRRFRPSGPFERGLKALVSRQ